MLRALLLLCVLTLAGGRLSTAASQLAKPYPLHANIVATTFWVGEVFSSSIADGSQVCSAYDPKWAFDWSGGISVGKDPSTACAGAPLGGCDGVPSGRGQSFQCATERRTAANGYFPTAPGVHPAENPFYLDLPFDDVNDPIAFAERCRVIPWAKVIDRAGAHCRDRSFSYMKNRWVAISGPNGQTCYGQIEDAGPSHDSLYHDARYVFGSNNVQPVQGQFNNAGMDVSPALNGCLGFAELDGDSDQVSWRFTDAPPPGPWTRIVTVDPTVERPILLSPRIATAGCRQGPLPDRRCSPGAYYRSLTKALLCSPSFHTSSRDVPDSEKHAVEIEYGMTPRAYGRTIEIDHIVSLELGGSNDIANLYPEPGSGKASYHVKDKLENKLHAMVCAGQISLHAAQVGIASNWQVLYLKVFGVPAAYGVGGRKTRRAEGVRSRLQHPLGASGG